MRNEIGALEGNCPVQSEGFIDDHPYYFRARGSHWTFDVAAPAGDAVGGHSVYSKAGYVGPWPAAGWLGVEEAKGIIADCVLEFRVGKRGVFECACVDCTRLRAMTQEERIADKMAKYAERSR
jgi:hypothetical protein